MTPVRGAEYAFCVLDEQSYEGISDKALGTLRAFRGKLWRSMDSPSFDASQVKVAVLRMKGLEFDGVYVPMVESFLLGVLTEMRKLGIKDKKVFSMYSVQMKEVLDVEGKNANGLFYSYPDVDLQSDAISYFPSQGK